MFENFVESYQHFFQTVVSFVDVSIINIYRIMDILLIWAFCGFWRPFWILRLVKFTKFFQIKSPWKIICNGIANLRAKFTFLSKIWKVTAIKNKTMWIWLPFWTICWFWRPFWILIFLSIYIRLPNYYAWASFALRLIIWELILCFCHKYDKCYGN